MALSNWETGKNPPGATTYLRMAKLAKPDERRWFISQAQNETTSLAVEVIGAQTAIKGYKHLRSIPVFRDAAAAGTPRAIDEREIEYSLQLPGELLPRGGELHGLKVEGNSMSPFIETGYIVIVDVERKKVEELIGRMVVAREMEAVTIKWLRKIGDGYKLVPQNPSTRNPELILAGSVEIVGEVVKWIGQPNAPKRK
jgi:SOS-response transcriptional repressor LexA